MQQGDIYRMVYFDMAPGRHGKIASEAHKNSAQPVASHIYASTRRIVCCHAARSDCAADMLKNVQDKDSPSDE